MFDNKYYAEKKQKLIQKAQQLQNEHINGAFKLVAEIGDIQAELNKIQEWEKEQAKETKKDGQTEVVKEVVEPANPGKK